MQQSLHLWLTENYKIWHAEDKEVDEEGEDIDSCQHVVHPVLVESLCQLGMSKIMTIAILLELNLLKTLLIVPLNLC